MMEVSDHPCGCGETGRRAGFRFQFPQGSVGSSPIIRTKSICTTRGIPASNVSERLENIMNKLIGVKLNIIRSAALIAGTVGLAAPIVMGILPAPLQGQSVKRESDPSKLVRMQETVLKYSLFKMREAIDKFLAERKQYPSSLSQLVSEGYISQIPTDPFTDRFDSWKIIPVKSDPNNPASAMGIHDVSSSSEATAMDGTKYSTW